MSADGLRPGGDAASARDGLKQANAIPPYSGNAVALQRDSRFDRHDRSPASVMKPDYIAHSAFGAKGRKSRFMEMRGRRRGQNHAAGPWPPQAQRRVKGWPSTDSRPDHPFRCAPDPGCDGRQGPRIQPDRLIEIGDGAFEIPLSAQAPFLDRNRRLRAPAKA